MMVLGGRAFRICGREGGALTIGISAFVRDSGSLLAFSVTCECSEKIEDGHSEVGSHQTLNLP